MHNVGSFKPAEIFTIGYEGRSLADFVREVTQNAIDALIDVRHTPWSRKPGFSKVQLARALEAVGVGYHHAGVLGTAPALRDQLRATGDWDRFAEEYAGHVRGLNGDVEETLAPFAGKRVCLLCFEADHERCHRSILAAALSERGIGTAPTHL